MDFKEDKYYWIKKASQPHIQRMMELECADIDKGVLIGSHATRYLIFNYDEVISADGHRKYEFIIEYDSYIPSQGIYFGCRSTTLDGFNHLEEIKSAADDWQRIMPEVVKRLNNVFVDKDFSSRFKVTDNVNHGTFWPFWISLHEDEDIREIAVRALKIIATAFKDYIAQKGFITEQKKISDFKKSNNPVHTAFTEEAFRRLEQTWRKNIKTACRNENSDNLQDTGWNIFIEILDTLTQQNIFNKIGYYEKGWALAEDLGDVDFKAIILAIFEIIEEKLGIRNIKIPWNSCIDIFMRGNGSPFKIQVKTLFLKADRYEKWQKYIKKICQNNSFPRD